MLLFVFIILWLVNFGNCSSTDTYYTFEWSIKASIWTSNKYYNFQYPLYQSVPFSTSNITIKLESASINWHTLWVWSWNASTDWIYLYSIKAFYIKSDWTDQSYSISSSSSQSDTLVLNSSSYNSIVALWIVYKGVSWTFSCTTTNPCPVSLSYKITYDDNSSYNFNPTCWNLICNCEDQVSFCTSQLSSCMSNYSSCQSSLNTLSWSLASCESDYWQCQSDLANCGEWICPELTWWSCEYESGDIQWSSLFINQIQYFGASNIDITIPDEIAWDYTGDEDNFYLDVEWLNGDTEYIQSIIDINSYRPSSSDFTDVFVSGLTLVMPYIVILLFIVFIRKLIKRIFK